MVSQEVTLFRSHTPLSPYLHTFCAGRGFGLFCVGGRRLRSIRFCDFYSDKVEPCTLCLRLHVSCQLSLAAYLPWCHALHTKLEKVHKKVLPAHGA